MQIAVEVRVDVVEVEVVFVVFVMVIVFVVVVNVGGGITVVVREIVLHATVVVDAEIVVDPTLVEVYMEVTASGVEVMPTVTVGVAVTVVGAPTVKVNVLTYAKVRPSITIYQVPLNISVCKMGHVDRNDVLFGLVAIWVQKYSFSSGSTRMGVISSSSHPSNCVKNVKSIASVSSMK